MITSNRGTHHKLTEEKGIRSLCLSLLIVAVLAFVSILPVRSYAQNEPLVTIDGKPIMPDIIQKMTKKEPQSDETTKEPANKPKKDVNPDRIPSLLFTYWEHTALMDAKKARGSVRPPTKHEIKPRVSHVKTVPKIKPPPEERDLRLGGIVYVSSEDWTIWLNGKRITPNAIVPEVIDLHVFEEFIEIKWHDDYTNQIFPVRLRTHQRFNLDTRIFLPG